MTAGPGMGSSTSGSKVYLRHTSAGTTGGSSKTWSFTYVAPAAGFGTMNFYAIGMNANGTGGTGGDQCYTKGFAFTEATVTLPAITTGTINGPLCEGSTVQIPYTTTAAFNAGNIFSVEMSDAAGSFTSPTVLGNATATSSGNISVVIPQGTSGTGFRFRVKGTNPAVTGTNNGADVAINPTPATPVVTATTDTLFSNASTGNQWYSSTNGLIAGATNAFYVPAATDGYYVVVTNGGCASANSNTVQFNMTTGTISVAKSELSVYPNPANDLVQVRIPEGLSAPEIWVNDMSGRPVLHQKVVSGQTVSIPVQQWANGFYLLRLSGGNNLMSTRFLVK